MEASQLNRFLLSCKLGNMATVFSLWCFSMIFFRAKNIRTAGYIITHLTQGWGDFIGRMNDYVFLTTNLFLNRPADFSVALSLLGILVMIHFLQRSGSIREKLSTTPLWVRSTIYIAMILGVIFGGKFGTESRSYIYFQF
jgi:alginate O-acetyltransferase complex protein AlgI